MQKKTKYLNKKWKITQDLTVWHKCGEGYFTWRVFTRGMMVHVADPCDCVLRRPPSDVRKILRLLNFMEKMKNYGTD